MAQGRSLNRWFYAVLLISTIIDLTYTLNSLPQSNVHFREKRYSLGPLPVAGHSSTYQNAHKLNQGYCGKRGNSDALSNAVAGESWPWMVALGYEKQGRSPWLCGGILITDRHVLTAALCANSDYGLAAVRIGASKLDGAINNDTDIPIKESKVHSSYSQKAHENDIAILKLARPVTLSDKIRPICLPLEPKLKRNQFEGETATVIGYGKVELSGPYNDNLQTIKLKVKDKTSCMKAYSNLGASINDRVLCAGVEEKGKDACQGFSGGPLMISVDGKYNAIGIVSFGKGCGDPEFPGVYTRISEFSEWITEAVK